MISLKLIEATFVKIASLREDGSLSTMSTDVSFEEAQGVEFLCPKCFAANKGPVGTHAIICWSRSRGVPDGIEPAPGRWTLEGGSLEKLTLGAEPGKTRSILLTGKGCKWHGYVTNGKAHE